MGFGEKVLDRKLLGRERESLKTNRWKNEIQTS